MHESRSRVMPEHWTVTWPWPWTSRAAGVAWASGLAVAAAIAWLASQGGPAPTWAAQSLGIAMKLLPLYFIVLLGIVIGRLLPLDRGTVGTVLVRAVSPVVFFGAVASAPVVFRDLALPALFLAVPSTICFAARRLLRPLLPGPEAALASFLIGSANVGYFGVPAALAVLPHSAFSTYMLCLLGFAAYENSVGYYTLARGRAALDGLRRVARLPAVYAIALGLAASSAGLSGGPELKALWEAFKGCYVVLGMLTLGLGLSRLPCLRTSLRFVALTALGRSLLWPLAAAGLILADIVLGNPVGTDMQRITLLLATLPCATSGAIFATELGLEPDKASATVLATTLLALLVVPLAALLLPTGT